MTADSVLKIKPVLPDAAALRKQLAGFRAPADHITSTRQKLEERKSDRAEQLQHIDPLDDKALAQLSALNMQVELLPGVIERHTNKLRDEGCAPLQHAADEFEALVLAALRECADARRRAIAEILAQLFPGEVGSPALGFQPHAQRIAGESQLVLRVLALADQVDASDHEMAHQRNDWMTALPATVQRLLDLADQAKKL